MHKFACLRKQVKQRGKSENDERRKGGGKIVQVVSRRESRNIGHPGTPRAAEWRARRRLVSLRDTAKPLKNSDNTSPGGGAHLNVCIHTLVYRFDERCGQNYSN